MYYAQCFVEMEMFTYLQIIFEWAMGKSFVIINSTHLFSYVIWFPMKKKNNKQTCLHDHIAQWVAYLTQ